ncbi:MAG: hypothetical protein LJE65_04485, partial [Desulfobacteraceae bacterium]|nr:hypothetical protein [Desulfobacteraceae bacterium]
MPSQPSDPLAALPSSLAGTVRSHLKETGVSPEVPAVHRLLDDLSWAYSQETAFGHAVCRGFVKLVGSVPDEDLMAYHRRTRACGSVGPTLGWAMATFLAPVVHSGRAELLHSFEDAFRTMAEKGTYTLAPALRILENLLDQREAESAAAYLDLLTEAFSGDLLYNRCQHLSRILPEAVSGMDPVHRLDQIRQLHRVVAFDVRLAEAFVTGLQRGLSSLARPQLARFVEEALQRAGQRYETGEAFLSVQTRGARSRLREWKVSVPLSQVRYPLSRYLQARIGGGIAVRPLSALTRNRARGSGFPRYICSDGKTVYLTEEIGVFPTVEQNRELYKCLVKLEGMYHEFGTFLFDLERFQDRYPTLFPSGA